jgi:hypothetical protein
LASIRVIVLEIGLEGQRKITSTKRWIFEIQDQKLPYRMLFKRFAV